LGSALPARLDPARLDPGARGTRQPAPMHHARSSRSSRCTFRLSMEPEHEAPQGLPANNEEAQKLLRYAQAMWAYVAA
jgi:hypothetical protein